MSRKPSKTVVLTCCGCGKKERFPASSPAAPMLTASEASAKKGWSYSIGFFAMLTGNHENRCPVCTRGAEDTGAAKAPVEQDARRPDGLALVQPPPEGVAFMVGEVEPNHRK